MADLLVIIATIWGPFVIYLVYVLIDRRDLRRGCPRKIEPECWWEFHIECSGCDCDCHDGLPFTDAPHVAPHEPPAPPDLRAGREPGAGLHLAPDWRETTFTGRLLAAATGTPEEMDAVFAERRSA